MTALGPLKTHPEDRDSRDRAAPASPPAPGAPHRAGTRRARQPAPPVNDPTRTTTHIPLCVARPDSVRSTRGIGDQSRLNIVAAPQGPRCNDYDVIQHGGSAETLIACKEGVPACPESPQILDSTLGVLMFGRGRVSE